MTFAARYRLTAKIIEALADYDMKDVSLYDIPETSLWAIRITDHAFGDIDLVNMIARDIVEPCGVEISSFGANCRYATDDKVGAVIVFRPI
jgi:hypothetical protein